MVEKDDWGVWSKHVLHELERLNKSYEHLRKEMSGIREELAVLKFKSGLWGAVGASIPVIMMILFQNYIK